MHPKDSFSKWDWQPTASNVKYLSAVSKTIGYEDTCAASGKTHLLDLLVYLCLQKVNEQSQNKDFVQKQAKYDEQL